MCQSCELFLKKMDLLLATEFILIEQVWNKKSVQISKLSHDVPVNKYLSDSTYKAAENFNGVWPEPAIHHAVKFPETADKANLCTTIARSKSSENKRKEAGSCWKNSFI